MPTATGAMSLLQALRRGEPSLSLIAGSVSALVGSAVHDLNQGKGGLLAEERTATSLATSSRNMGWGTDTQTRRGLDTRRQRSKTLNL
jgi:hypothetical protein